MRDKTYLDFRLYKDVQPKPRAKSRIVYLDYPHNQPWQAEPEPVSASEYDLVHLVKSIEPPTTRVLFVENATATMVNTLGSSLNLDPLFFADHFHTPSQDAYETPLQPLHSALPPRIATSSQAHIHYYHPVAFKTTDHYVEVPHTLKTRSNRPRNVRRMEGRDIAVAHGCCSFIVKAVGTSRICLFLVDPPITSLEEPGTGTKRSWQVQALLGGFGGLPSPPSFSPFPKKMKKDRLDKISMLDSIIHYLQQQPPPEFHTSSPTLLNPGYFLIRIVLAEWTFYTYLTSQYVKYYEYLIRNKIEEPLQCEDIIDLQRWKRHSNVGQYRLIVLAEIITSYMPEGDEKGPWELLLQDTNWFPEQLHDYCQSLEQAVTVLESIIRISDSLHSTHRAANIKHLTYLALFFIPLSFATTLFGMNI
ncbi:hypothetical protein NCS52_01456100 [Fusarium sp. LHS14.1]|nr:hypothetical protein NCS52_01456100 [Fusarium sp. LHS14.1]